MPARLPIQLATCGTLYTMHWNGYSSGVLPQSSLSVPFSVSYGQDICKLYFPDSLGIDFQQAADNGRHWQETGRWEEGRALFSAMFPSWQCAWRVPACIPASAAVQAPIALSAQHCWTLDSCSVTRSVGSWLPSAVVWEEL